VRRGEGTIEHGAVLRVATLNIQTLCRSTVHHQLADYMKRYKIDVLCLQETKLAATTQYVVDDALFVLMGHGEDRPEYAGIAFVFSKRVRRAITGFESIVPGRVAMVGLDLAPRRLTLVCAYMPQSGRPEEERQEAYGGLAQAVQAAARKGIAIALGDFNARIHGRLRGEEEIFGPRIYGEGVARILNPGRGHGEKTNRDMLAEVCAERSMCVANTWFMKPDSQKVTYMAPGVERLPEAGQWPPAQFAELDLCLISRRWKGAVKDVRSRPFAGLPTDHFPLEVELQVRLRAAKGRGQAIERWDFGAASAEQKERFDVEVAAVEQEMETAGGVEEAWAALVGAVEGAMRRNIPPKARPPRKPWIRQSTLELIEHRRALAATGLVKEAKELDAMVKSQRQRG